MSSKAMAFTTPAGQYASWAHRSHPTRTSSAPNPSAISSQRVHTPSRCCRYTPEVRSVNRASFFSQLPTLRGPSQHVHARTRVPPAHATNDDQVSFKPGSSTREETTEEASAAEGTTESTAPSGEEEEYAKGIEYVPLAELERQERQRIKEEKKLLGTQLLEEGKKAYEYCKYPKAVRCLNECLDNVSKESEQGGQAQMWLAMAYDASGRGDDALNIYKKLEKSHPIPMIKQQAAGLRAIQEAPKLKVAKNERPKGIELKEYDSWQAKQRSYKRPLNKKVPLTLEERVLSEWAPPPVRLPNFYSYFAAAAVLLILAWYSTTLK